MKVKIFAVVMAVACLMSLMCVTAFAAETDLPPGAQLLTNGQQISTDSLTNLDSPHVIAADGVETISIKGLFGFSWIYGWNGTNWVRIDVSDATDVTITCADYPQYSYYTAIRRDTMASQTVTVSWVESSLISKAGAFLGGFFTEIGAPTVQFMTSHVLVLVPAIIGLVGIGIWIIRKFVYGA